MCTVTFIPVDNKILLTSNRDEKLKRSKALEPAFYPDYSGKLLFPKDGEAGGTWIAASENGHVVVLLNGAFHAHVPSPPYRKSRGLILLSILNDDSPYQNFQNINLDNIEPFTLVILEEEGLYECRWDGQTKFFNRIDEKIPHIWSSATLYSKEVISERERWFAHWLEKFPEPSQEQVLEFHQHTGHGDPANAISMNREGVLKTISVTSVAKKASEISMTYIDLTDNQRYHQNLVIEKIATGG